MEYFEKACDFYKNGDYKSALLFYDKYIKEEYDSSSKASGFYNKGVCSIKLSLYNEAIEFFKEALILKRESKYYYNIGYCYYKLSDYKRAAIYFKTANSLDNTDNECKHALEIIEKRLRLKEK